MLHQPQVTPPSPIYLLAQALADLYFSTFHDLRLHGTENLPEGGCLIACNHDSFFDPPAISCRLTCRPAFLARKSLFKPPAFDRLLPQLQAIPVDQENPDMVGLKRIIAEAKSGVPVILFPEGSRSFDGHLQPPMPGIGLVLSKSGVPVVPARIFGAHNAWPRGGRPLPFHPIRVVFGHPFQPQSDQPDKKMRYQQLGEQVMDRIASLTLPE
jgi:1-acyl-sn-glycerol-3-phosphate acyltransferase